MSQRSKIRSMPGGRRVGALAAATAGVVGLFAALVVVPQARARTMSPAEQRAGSTGLTATAGSAVSGTASAALQQLHSVVDELDALPPVPNTAWGIDPAAGHVVLVVSDAAESTAAARLVGAANRLGSAVHVEHVSGPFTEQVYDGDEIATSQILCSAGFNVTKGGKNYVITAGHCTQGLPEWQGIGPSVDSSFPGTDYGLIENDSSSAPGAVDLYNGSTQPITSVGNATVGEHVCKSGRTTEVTCGTVEALDVTVDYGNGDVVHGLIKTNVRSDHGDSGAPLYDGSTGLGTVSGGNTTTDFFQPLAPAMSHYGVALAG